MSLQSLLCDPNPNSPANSEAARMYSENRREYNRRVREIVEQSWTAEWHCFAVLWGLVLEVPACQDRLVWGLKSVDPWDKRAGLLVQSVLDFWTPLYIHVYSSFLETKASIVPGSSILGYCKTSLVSQQIYAVVSQMLLWLQWNGCYPKMGLLAAWNCQWCVFGFCSIVFGLSFSIKS